MLTFLTRWMEDFQIDGIRMDSVENVANWDFIREFKDSAREQFKQRYPAAGAAADAKFLVVGEELEMPPELLSGERPGRWLWNERFQGLVRAALIGENADGLNFEDTVRRAIDCRIERVFDDGAQAINYLTSHDVEGKTQRAALQPHGGHVSLWRAANRYLIVGRSRPRYATVFDAKGGNPSRTKCATAPVKSSCIGRGCAASSWDSSAS